MIPPSSRPSTTPFSPCFSAFVLAHLTLFPTTLTEQPDPYPPVKIYGYYTPAEVSKHKTKDDLWLIIQPKGSGKRKVYNVSDYVEEHPGEDSIFNNAGGDATEGFLGPQHPDNATIILEEYCIGEVVEE